MGSEEREQHAQRVAEALAAPDAGPAGDSRAPVFGEWMRGIWASERNPQRDGRYVRTTRRTGRFNPGKFYELTDGRGSFWEYPADSTVFLRSASPPSPQEGQTAGSIFMLPNGLNAEQATACMEAISKAYHAGLQAAGEEHTDGAGVRAEATYSGWLWTHNVRGGEYRMIGSAKLQTDTPLRDMAEVVVYRGEDGRLWVRAADEWDARFKRGRPDPAFAGQTLAAAGASGAPAEPRTIFCPACFVEVTQEQADAQTRAARTLSAFAKTAPGRLPSLVQEAMAVVDGAAVDASSNDQGEK